MIELLNLSLKYCVMNLSVYETVNPSEYIPYKPYPYVI